MTTYIEQIAPNIHDLKLKQIWRDAKLKMLNLFLSPLVGVKCESCELFLWAVHLENFFWLCLLCIQFSTFNACCFRTVHNVEWSSSIPRQVSRRESDSSHR